MTSTEEQRKIIELAVSARTLGDAMKVAGLIERAVGARYQRPVGDRFNNYGLMASSGSYEYKALEPVTNQQDAVLERFAAKKFGSDLSSVPYTSPTEAAKALVGDLSYQEQADKASVSFFESDPPTRANKKLTIVYRDLGCGIEAKNVPNTIFALGSSHKTGSQWHQGAFGIGGASTYRNARAVVLVTRRAPEMAPERDEITVAVVTWEAHGKGQSASYLVTTDWENDKSAQPWSAPASAFPEFDYGTQLSLISYGVEGFHRARSGDERSLDMVLNTRLYEPVMPVKFTNEITRSKKEYLRGLKRRFEDNPSTERLSDTEEMLYSFGGETYKLPVTYFVFPVGDKGTRRRFVAKGHALVFTSNGQVHNHWSPQDFRQRTKLNKLYDRIFVVVETDNLPIELRTGLFTPDRSQLLANEAALQLEDQVANFIDNWHSLIEINSQLVRDAISSASSGHSALEVGKRIAEALRVKGFNMAGSGTSGGGKLTPQPGPRVRKKVETYPDPTALEGPDSLVVQDGKVRYLEYMLNAVDDFLNSGRGEFTFETNHPDIDPNKHISVGRLRDGYVRVQLQIPEGAAEGTFNLTARMEDWHKAAGGMGPSLTYTTLVTVVDELAPKPPRGPGEGPGNKGAGQGVQVAVIWGRPDTFPELHNGSPGFIDDLAASDIAASRPEYADLAGLGEQLIPTITLNESYTAFKSYISSRAKELTAAGTEDASDRYAVGVGLGILSLHEGLKVETEKKHTAMSEPQLLVAKQSIARSVLAMMPAFDRLAKESGVEES